MYIPTSFPYLPLNEHSGNFAHWSAMVELWLVTCNLLDLLVGKEKALMLSAKAANKTDADYASQVLAFDVSAEARLFRECQGIIKGLSAMAVQSSEIVHFVGVTDPLITWKTLEDKYQACTAHDSVSLASGVEEITEIQSGFKQIELGKLICNNPFIQLILHSEQVKLGQLTLESTVNQIHSLEQYYPSFGSVIHISSERQKPKDFDAMKGYKWEQEWRSSDIANVLSPSIPVQNSLPPPLLAVSQHSASLSSTTSSFTPFHVDSAATARMESDVAHFACYTQFGSPVEVKLAKDYVVHAPEWGIILEEVLSSWVVHLVPPLHGWINKKDHVSCMQKTTETTQHLQHKHQPASCCHSLHGTAALGMQGIQPFLRLSVLY
ncbi:hypothetical protein BV22DRAFT_1051463 [Leucogyrophana mollusca]|uniref:Uncharacterized protein n=1 Tax=Leucogyrophana mollusca TaxID=85980 RepID=A0ACB8AZ55_9AGAM|nr:hypothetical protein BV22DRAFT_1051463 [Leucogyrophana mollusca]